MVNASGVAERTIIDFERGARRPISATMQALAAAFERAGVEFVDDRGVQLRPDPEVSG